VLPSSYWQRLDIVWWHRVGDLNNGITLISLGANEVIYRSVLSVASEPLSTERWGGVVDSVGGHTLASALSGCAYGAAVAACGLAGSRDLPTTVLPFIMRSVTLIGVDSVYCSLVKRLEAWSRLTELLPAGLPGDVIEEITLAELPARAAEFVNGQVRGRVVVKLAWCAEVTAPERTL
jgi:acrylyl-CoA reductase (NADPH)